MLHLLTGKFKELTKHLSLGTRLLCATLAAALLVMTTTELYRIHLSKIEQMQNLQAKVQVIAKLVSRLAASPLYLIDDEAVRDIVQSLAIDEDISSIRIDDSSGRMVAELGAATPGDLTSEAAIDYRTLQDVIPVGRLTVSLNTAAVGRELLRNLIIGFTGLTAVFTALAGIIILSFRHITTPLRQISNSLLLLAAGRKDVEINWQDRNDEIGDIARSARIFRNHALQVEELEKSRNAALILKESEERLRLIFNNMPVPVLMTHQGDCRVMFANGEFWELCGKLHDVTAHGELPPVLKRLLIGVVESGGVAEREVYLEGEGAGRIWVIMSCVLTQFRSDPVLLTSLVDITVRREIEKNLIAAHELAAEAQRKVTSLLHNSGQGFLSFDQTLVVDTEYSHACETMLGQSLAGRSIAEFLFPGDATKAALLRSGISRALNEQDPDRRDLFLSLLPSELTLDSAVLRLEYRPLDGGRMMMMLTDVYETRQLEAQINAERQRFAMVISAVTESRDFFATIDDFEEFASSGLWSILVMPRAPQEVVEEIYREVHTFKGLFSQMNFKELPAALHELEGGLSGLRDLGDSLVLEQVTILTTSVPYYELLSADLETLSAVLGPLFLKDRGVFALSADQMKRLERLLTALQRGEIEQFDSPDNRVLISEISALCKVSLKTTLMSYNRLVAEAARRSGKEMLDVSVRGDDILLNTERFRPLQRTLVHVFRNAVVHGIEDAESRLRAGKLETGRIVCDIHLEQERVVFSISDDGGGIDPDALRRRAVRQGLYTEAEAAALSDGQALELIFLDNFSTASTATDLAGRGVGLATVRDAVIEIDGSVRVQTVPGKGTSFLFELPR